MARPRQRVELVPRDPDRLSTSPETKKSQVARSVVGIEPAWSTGHFSVRYWPGRQPRGVVPGFDDLPLRSAPEHWCNTSPDGRYCVTGRAGDRASSSASAGPDAASYLQAMVSNDVEALAIGDSCEALLLTPKARVIAPLVVFRRAADDFLLLTEPGLGERVRATLVRSRFAAKCEIEVEEHASVVVLGRRRRRVSRQPTTGCPPSRSSTRRSEPTVDDDELELLRIRAGTPRFGRELDDRVLPAEAGLDKRAIDFEKGCYPGQEPIARQHYRGRVNRTLRVLEIEGDDLPAYDAEIDLRGQGRRPGDERNPQRRACGCARLRAGRGTHERTPASRGPRSAPGMIRTCDLCLRRAALYPLSYGRSAGQSSVRAHSVMER